MNIVRHSVRSNHGRTKGRFVSEKVFNWKQNLRASRQKSGDGGSEVSARTYVDSGRRVVDFGTLAQDLWCDICNVPLSLRNVMHEERFGMASRLDVLCEQCKENHTVETNKRRENNRLYDVNSKAAIAMIDAGIGETQFNTVLSALNIPALTGTILKRYERHVGPAFEKAAEDSCHAKTTRDILYEEEIAVTQARNKQSLLAMKETVSAGMIGKMAKTGITMQVLESAYVRSGAEGIRILLGEDVNGKPRVTKNNKIFKAIVAHVEKTTVTKIG